MDEIDQNQMFKQQRLLYKNLTYNSPNPNIVFGLSIDGGGSNFIIPGIILAEIEKRTGKYIASLFDIIGGSSIGSIIATTLVYENKQTHLPKYNSYQILNWLININNAINSDKHYQDPMQVQEQIQSTFGIIQILKEMINVNRQYTDTLKPLLISTVNLLNDVKFQGNIEYLDSQNSQYEDWSIFEALKASTNVLNYFTPFFKNHKKYIDGSFKVPNPSEKITQKAFELLQTKPNYPYNTKVIILSLGFGQNLKNQGWPKNRHKNNKQKLIELSDENTKNMVNEQNYFRWNIDLSNHVSPSNDSNTLIKYGQELIAQLDQSGEFNEFISLFKLDN